jgi:hypothetical protein
VDRKLADFPAIQVNLSPVGGDQADDHIETSGLARAVRPQEPYHFAVFTKDAS